MKKVFAKILFLIAILLPTALLENTTYAALYTVNPNYTTAKVMDVFDPNQNPGYNPTPYGYWTKNWQVNAQWVYVWAQFANTWSTGVYNNHSGDDCTYWTNAGDSWYSNVQCMYDWWDYFYNHGGSSGFNPWVPGFQMKPIYDSFWTWVQQDNDTTAPSFDSVRVDGFRYFNGTDYWVRPGDTVNVVIKGYDSQSGIKNSYLRLNNINNDDRINYDWSVHGITNQFGTHPYTNVIGASETFNFGGYKEVTYTTNVYPNSDNQNFDIMAYFTDNVGNSSVDYVDTGRNLRVDGTPPTVSASPSSGGWTNGSIPVALSYSDSGSGVATKQYAWTTSTADPTTWTNYTGAVTQSSDGIWYLHYQTTDNVGNTTTGYFGPYKIDTISPTGTITENTANWSQTITLTASGSDSLSGMYQIKNPDGSFTTGASSTFTVSANGTYSFTFIDNAGNTYTKSITVGNIDNTPPFPWGIYLSPSTNTNQNVTIYVNGGDIDSGVNHIVLPNGTSVYQPNTSYTVSSNGTYKFTIVDNVGLTYDYYAIVSNIDKANPTLNNLTIVKQNNNYQVTVKTSDPSGISSVVLDNGQTINKASDGDYYFVQGLTSLPSFVTITDAAGNAVNYNFLDIPTNNYSSSGTTNQDVPVTISGSGTLSYKVNYQNYTCSASPCSLTVSMNSTLTAINQSGVKTSMSVFNVSNIDKTQTNFALSGTRSASNSSVINLSWNQSLSSGTLTCNTPDGQSTFNVSGTSYSINGKNYQYNCQVAGTSNGSSVQSNWLLIDANTQDGTMVVTKPTDNVPTVSFGNNVNVNVEKNPLGEFYIINSTTQNEGTISVPIPKYIQ